VRSSTAANLAGRFRRRWQGTQPDAAREAGKEGDMIDLFQTNGSSPSADFLLRPISESAQEHRPEDATWFGGAVVVEHRYIGPIIGGAIGDGLLVQ
jgi:hypothetical protein